jgi:hypothetical protein
MDLQFLIMLFPVVFMFHDMEEIIFFESWLRRNKPVIHQRFPKLSRRVLPHLERLSTAAFALAVAEEFVLLSAITCLSVIRNSYGWWFAIFMAFSLHLLGHVVQWLVFRRYVPSIVTALLCLPYCGHTLYRFLATSTMTAVQVLLWTLIGLVLMIANLLLAHKLAGAFDRWDARRSPTPNG